MASLLALMLVLTFFPDMSIPVMANTSAPTKCNLEKILDEESLEWEGVFSGTPNPGCGNITRVPFSGDEDDREMSEEIACEWVCNNHKNVLSNASLTYFQNMLLGDAADIRFFHTEDGDPDGRGFDQCPYCGWKNPISSECNEDDHIRVMGINPGVEVTYAVYGNRRRTASTGGNHFGNFTDAPEIGKIYDFVDGKYTLCPHSNHEHDYANTWSSDATSHWKACNSTTGDCDTPKKDVADHSFLWITDVPATATTAGKKHEECSVCKYKRNENTVIPATGGGDSGKIDIPKNKEEGNFGAGGLANTVNEIKNAVLTKEDKDAMVEGKNINVWAEIKKQDTDKVKDAEKQKINAKLPATFNVGAYLDIKLFKQMTGDDVPTSIEKTNGKVKIKFTVPKELQKGDRTYDIIRLHDGEATVLGVTREGYELTMETDGFSTYALIYSDNPAVSTNANKAITSPKTGESSTPYAGIALMMASAFVFLTATKKREA